MLDIGARYGANNYDPLPVMLARGEGAWVWDVEGKRYLDLLSAYSALNFGHAHPELVSALVKQANTFSLCSRAFNCDQLVHFCRELAEFCGLEAVLPMNSGTEAVETALKVARKWGAERKGLAGDRAKIIVMANNFHGRSITVISFSTEPAYREGFGPFTPGFEVVEFGNIGALESACDDNTIAVLLEPIQAEAGILIPQAGYLKKVRDICTKRRCLLILDEIQTGLGRTGRNFCFQHEGIVPDILVVGKSLGGGLLPVSAIVSTRGIMDVIQPGQHGSTFGGNPLAAAVGRRALQLLGELDLPQRAQRMGELIAQRLVAVRKSPAVVDVRGCGALYAIELRPEAGGARRYCELLSTRGVLCKETHSHVIRIAPPLTIPTSDLEWGLNQIVETVLNY